ncbi:MAG: threonine dehydratase [Aulosira sp. ZfuVER01]|nr:threonine dehydratase [Aulosira sp. ZfuVER01]MDZ8001748.1 threonine dehydratase [Aulosira sp. DedVER01a]MDZ8056392.1 threonine dehydratase [Aulosira sp. ZfuCHP01]
MFRLTQIIRNLYLRIEGFVSVILRNIANFFKNFFGFFANLFGLTESGYFLESDQAQSTKRVETQQKIESKPDITTENTATKRRRSNAKMDYYLNMARDIKKS